MSTFFIPYADNSPAAVDIKGHRLLIIATALEDIACDLNAIGGEEVREVALNEDEAETEALADLAAEVQGGVVVTPPGVRSSVMLHNLEQELPWVH